MNDQDNAPARLLKVLSKHVVQLSCLDAKTEPEGTPTDVRNFDPKEFSITAFVISVRDVWFLVTAGHVLRDVEERLKTGRQIVKSRLIDGFGTDETLPPIVFAFEDMPKWHVFSDGLDYALIALRPLDVENLIAGGVEPLSEGSWTDMPEELDAYYLLGFPKQATDTTVDSRPDGGMVNVSTGTPLLPLRPITDPPEEMKLDAERFHAEVMLPAGSGDGADVCLTDISGMSGGPVFAIAHDGKKTLRYWVVAVQSSWLESSRILAACPIKPLVDDLVRCIDQQQMELEDHEIPGGGDRA